jgi:CRP-like cAMP-binding protein
VNFLPAKTSIFRGNSMDRLTARLATHAAAELEPAQVPAIYLNETPAGKQHSLTYVHRDAAHPSLHSSDQNLLLAALPATVLERLTTHLERVELRLGESIYQPGTKLRYAYFPTSAIVSLQHVLASGASAESAGVGNEGVVGISLFMGGDTMPSSAVVQTAGHAYRLTSRVFKDEFRRAGLVQGLLLRYTGALMIQMSQTAACNRHHTTEQQLCRWLLQTLDRSATREFFVTQEFVACMLGVRRESITGAVGKLQRAGLISYRRGHITVLERSGLETRACDCYAVVKKEFGRLHGSNVRYH